MCSNHKLTSWTLCAIISALICVTLGLACTIFLYQSGYFYNNNDNHHNNNKDLKSLLKSGTTKNIDTKSSSYMIDINDMYAPWGKWSKCRKRKQNRTRICIMPEGCGSNILKDEKPCRRTKRKFKIVKRRKLSRRERNEISKKRRFYSQWSKWSKCNLNTCTTARRRTCEYQTMCGEKTIKQEATCYSKGSKCENIFKPWANYGKKKMFGTNNDIGEAPYNDGSYSSVKHISSMNQCGYSSRKSRMAWALRILGGRETVSGKWPWQVAIVNRNKEVFCGGTLIHPEWVLTAAHCVKKQLFVRLGEHDILETEGTEIELMVLQVEIHPNYDVDTVDNDIALLRIPFNVKSSGKKRNKKQQRNGKEIQKLESSSNNSQKFQKKKKSVHSFSPACLPEQDEELPQDRFCTVLGWGKENVKHSYGSDVLKQAEVPIVPDKECRNAYEGYNITDNMFCAGFEKGRTDTCAGDSGGPLLCEKDGKWTIFGITSFGEECGKKGFYGMYAKVPNYTNWIKSVINEIK